MTRNEQIAGYLQGLDRGVCGEVLTLLELSARFGYVMVPESLQEHFDMINLICLRCAHDGYIQEPASPC